MRATGIMMAGRIAILVCPILVWLTTSVAFAGDSYGLSAGIIRHLPRTDAEMKVAHDRADSEACEPVPAGQPLEVPGFRLKVPYKVTGVGTDGNPVPQTIEFEAGRRAVISAGAEMTAGDQGALPMISGNKILDCVNNFYIAVEVRVHRYGPDGVPHLFHRPLGVVGSYTDSTKTQDFVDLVRSSVRDFRSIGLLLKPDEPASAESLRTLVLVNRNNIVDSHGARPRPNYEFVSIRARPGATPDGLQLYTFITSGKRTKLHWVPPFVPPKSLGDCVIRSTVFFTEFGFANVFPTARASRSTLIKSQGVWPIATLDDFAKTQGMHGDALSNLTEVLDAVIDGRIAMPADPALGAR